jgi:hypothetical protein
LDEEEASADALVGGGLAPASAARQLRRRVIGFRAAEQSSSTTSKRLVRPRPARRGEGRGLSIDHAARALDIERFSHPMAQAPG